MKKQNVLFDVHGCLGDLLALVEGFLLENFPELNWSRKQVINWDIFGCIHLKEAREAVFEYLVSPNFLFDVPVVSEAKIAYDKLLEVGHNVNICTTPLSGAHEKHSKRDVLNWVRIHFGQKDAERIIFSFDKTKEDADVIIDDKPNLTLDKFGIKFKHWLIVDHPYNQNLSHSLTLLPIGRINNDWSNWEEEFEKLELI